MRSPDHPSESLESRLHCPNGCDYSIAADAPWVCTCPRCGAICTDSVPDPPSLESQEGEGLAEIEARLAAATPGPWKRFDHDFGHTSEWGHDYGGDICTADHIWDEKRKEWGGSSVISSWGYDADGVDITDADADLIAHAPADIAYLLDTITALRRELTTTQEALRQAEARG